MGSKQQQAILRAPPARGRGNYNYDDGNRTTRTFGLFRWTVLLFLVAAYLDFRSVHRLVLTESLSRCPTPTGGGNNDLDAPTAPFSSSRRHRSKLIAEDDDDDDGPAALTAPSSRHRSHSIAAAADDDGPAGTTTTTTTSAATTREEEEEVAVVRAVDCRIPPAPYNDPNVGFKEDPKRLIDLDPTPEFWIALHKKGFDLIRWNSIMTNGDYYEKGITRIFQEILKPPARKGIVLDVGMNIGWFTVLSRAMGHEVLSFDPNPIMHRRVCSSLAYNGWWDPEKPRGGNSSSSDSSGVSTFLYGLGESSGTLEFEVGKNPGGGSFVTGRLDDEHDKKKRRWSVPVTTLDQVASERGWLSGDNDDPPPVIHMMKIDVEGYEPVVMRGASELIRSRACRNILHENTHTGRTTAEALDEVRAAFERLVAAGYKIHAMTTYTGKVPRPYKTLVGIANLRLFNGTFAGSDIHRHVAETHMNVWWKRLEEKAEAGGDDDDDDHTLEASIALWKELEIRHARKFPNGNGIPPTKKEREEKENAADNDDPRQRR